MPKIDTYDTDYITCPHCGNVSKEQHKDPLVYKLLLNNNIMLVCRKCKECYSVEMDISFTTRKAIINNGVIQIGGKNAQKKVSRTKQRR